jgi:hypothetical protein
MKKKLAMNGSFTTKVADCLIDHLHNTTVGSVEHHVTNATIRLVDRDGSVYILTLTKEA